MYLCGWSRRRVLSVSRPGFEPVGKATERRCSTGDGFRLTQEAGLGGAGHSGASGQARFPVKRSERRSVYSRANRGGGRRVNPCYRDAAGVSAPVPRQSGSIPLLPSAPSPIDSFPYGVDLDLTWPASPPVFYAFRLPTLRSSVSSAAATQGRGIIRKHFAADDLARQHRIGSVPGPREAKVL